MASTYHPVVPSTTEAVKAVQGEQKGNHELATEEDLSPGIFLQGILREFSTGVEHLSKALFGEK